MMQIGIHCLSLQYLSGFPRRNSEFLFTGDYTASQLTTMSGIPEICTYRRRKNGISQKDVRRA